MILLKKLLVPTDFSEPSKAALAYARELARQFGATLTVFHAVEPIAVYGGEIAVYEPKVQDELEAAARQQVEALLGDDDRQALGAQAIVVTAGFTAGAILDCARSIEADLIVLGTHGRSGVTHLLLGSVAERVVQRAPCPVLTVHHPEREFVVPNPEAAVEHV